MKKIAFKKLVVSFAGDVEETKKIELKLFKIDDSNYLLEWFCPKENERFEINIICLEVENIEKGREKYISEISGIDFIPEEVKEFLKSLGFYGIE